MKVKMYIVKGLPGSGKSTLAKELAEKTGATIYSTDDFWYLLGNGEYAYDPAMAGAAHLWNQKRVKAALARGESVIVDNTNLTRQQRAPYLDMINEFGFDGDVEIVEPTTPWWLAMRDDLKKIDEIARRWASILADKTIHGVPEEVIARMFKTWE